MPRTTNRKVLILGSGQYARPFLDIGELTIVNSQNFNPKDIDTYSLVVFTGGPDVNPKYYNDTWLHPNTQFEYARDQRDSLMYSLCQLYQIPKVGICRGGQFLTVMNGGSLIQDISNHQLAGTHPIRTTNKKFRDIQVTSTHHQMMKPPVEKRNYEILAYASGLSEYYENGMEISQLPDYGRDGKGKFKEPEVVWYPSTKSLAVQYHPEYMDEDSDGWKYFQQLLVEYVLH